jgi:hypothetical protein
MTDPEYSGGVVRELERRFRLASLLRPLRERRHERMEVLDYEVRGVWPPRPARVKLSVERHVGGGFAGQVYKVRFIEIDAPEGPVEGLERGGVYALKVLVPVSGFGRFIRNLLFGVGFQAPFAPQGNPDAARAGALWQKLIRRGARERWARAAVVDVWPPSSIRSQELRRDQRSGWTAGCGATRSTTTSSPGSAEAGPADRPGFAGIPG